MGPRWSTLGSAISCGEITFGIPLCWAAIIAEKNNIGNDHSDKISSLGILHRSCSIMGEKRETFGLAFGFYQIWFVTEAIVRLLSFLGVWKDTRISCYPFHRCRQGCCGWCWGTLESFRIHPGTLSARMRGNHRSSPSGGEQQNNVVKKI